MEEFFQKNFASKSTKATEDGNVWYLSHQGIYHPSISNKVRVVLDCSSKCNGRAINIEMLTNPDLANKLIGALARFKIGDLAFIGNWENVISKSSCSKTQELAKILKMKTTVIY